MNTRNLISEQIITITDIKLEHPRKDFKIDYRTDELVQSTVGGHKRFETGYIAVTRSNSDTTSFYNALEILKKTQEDSQAKVYAVLKMYESGRINLRILDDGVNHSSFQDAVEAHIEERLAAWNANPVMRDDHYSVEDALGEVRTLAFLEATGQMDLFNEYKNKVENTNTSDHENNDNQIINNQIITPEEYRAQVAERYLQLLDAWWANQFITLSQEEAEAAYDLLSKEARKQVTETQTIRLTSETFIQETVCELLAQEAAWETLPESSTIIVISDEYSESWAVWVDGAIYNDREDKILLPLLDRLDSEGKIDTVIEGFVNVDQETDKVTCDISTTPWKGFWWESDVLDYYRVNKEEYEDA